MKRILLSLMSVGTLLTAYAQDAALVVFSEAGEKFTLTINGEKKNDTPQTRVRVGGLSSGMAYQSTIVLKDVAGGTISKAVYLQPNTEANMMVKLNKKGRYVLRYAGEKPYSGEAVSREVSSVQNSSVPPAPQDYNNNVSTTSTTTTTTTNGNNNNNNTGDGSFSMNVNVNDPMGNASFNVKVNDGSAGNGNMNVTQSYSETTTTTTTTSNGTGSTYNSTTSSSGNTENGSYNDGRCDYPMDWSDFKSARSSITSKTFDDSKVKLTKQVIKGNCPTAEQVKEFVALMDYESSRLEIAKFAYDYCYDIGNYYKVNDAFQFESTIDELDSYIQSK